jgi:hypothetical protein
MVVLLMVIAVVMTKTAVEHAPDEILADLKAAVAYGIVQRRAAGAAAHVEVDVHGQQLYNYVGLTVPEQKVAVNGNTACMMMRNNKQQHGTKRGRSVWRTLRQCVGQCAGLGPPAAILTLLPPASAAVRCSGVEGGKR